ncbi:MAG: energy-coupling factor transporter ATPase [Ruminococcaceae bacterium]|nr:energy-coupling factor transporter ATPase [Oscillospiraceae bacterium]
MEFIVAEIIIKAEDICFSYESDHPTDNFPVLDHLNLEIEKGSFVAVLGYNGSGKSTLAKLLNLILTPTSGNLYLFGKKFDEETITEDEFFALRQRIGMVFQNPDNQLVATIVEEDVAFGPENLGVPPAEIRKRVDEALEIVGMKQFARHSPHQLSGGQKQRVAIAGIIALRPDVIIFDESTAMLDPRGRSDVLATIEKLNKEFGTTILHITHYMEEAIRADRVIVVDHGRVTLDGTPREVFSQVRTVKAAGLDVPQVTELMLEINDDGFDLPKDVLSYEEGANAIADYIRKKKAGKGS